MTSSDQDKRSASPNSGQFATTRWSMVAEAGRHSSPEAAAALADLCKIYWYPLYAYVRRQGQSKNDAQDRTQEFFVEILDKGTLQVADRERGRFRSFLLASLKNFLTNEWRRGKQHRGIDQLGRSIPGRPSVFCR